MSGSLRGPRISLPPPRSPWAGLPFVEPDEASAVAHSHRPEEGRYMQRAPCHSTPPQGTPPNVSPLPALLRWEGNPPLSVYEVPPAGEIISIFQKPSQIENQKPTPLNPADSDLCTSALRALGGQHTMLQTKEKEA